MSELPKELQGVLGCNGYDIISIKSDGRHWLLTKDDIDEIVRRYGGFTEQQKQILNLEEDLGYRKAILDGSWPSAVQILEIALVAAKGKIEPEQKPCQTCFGSGLTFEEIAEDALVGPCPDCGGTGYIPLAR